MSIITNFGLAKHEDGVLTIEMAPSEPIGGWNIEFAVKYRFNGETNLITKSCASGFSFGSSGSVSGLPVSGIGIVNSGQGIFSVRINTLDTSGLDYKNYAYLARRLDSGFATTVAEGFITLTP